MSVSGLRKIRFAIVCSLAGCSLLFAADIKPEEVIAKHLDAIGPAQTRKTIRSRAIQGATTYHILVGGSGAVDGKFQFASEGAKSDFLFRINANGFMGEQFICDGDKTSVAGTYTDHTRSEFGNFMLGQDLILRENLLGGVWSTEWPLLNLDEHKARLHVEGTKKIDGKELLAIRYEPRKRTDLDIFLYFDTQTYRHVLTIYKMEPSTSIAGGETAMAGKQTQRYRLEERFSEFKTVDGLTLPNRYDVRYTFEGETGFTKTVEWEVRALSIADNVSIDPRAFQVK